MASLSEGTYKVFLASNAELALDTTGASRGNGANVRVLTYDCDSDGMVFELFIRSDGTYRIVSRFSGKAIDTGDTPAAGQNVKQWTSFDTRDQSWDITDTGDTVTKWGTAYPAYTVSVDRAEAVSTVDGTGSVTLADAVGTIQKATIYGLYSDGSVVDSVTVGGTEYELPSFLASLPSGIADVATWDESGLTVQRNVGMMTEFDPEDEEQVELAGSDWYSTTGALDSGATVYYALPRQDSDIEQQADAAGLELDEEEPAGMASIEAHPEFALPSVSSGDVVGLPISAMLSVDYWTYEAAENTLYMTAASTSSNANVTIETSGDSSLQRWLFIPTPTFETGGVYEIHSYANHKIMLSANGTSNGANTYVLADNDSNAQKWVMAETADGKWSIQNVDSRLMLDAAGGRAANGTNVRQWNSNGTNAQRWYVTSYGTVGRDGQTCHLVKLSSWVTDPTDATVTHYNLDVNGASKSVTNKANVCLYQDDDSTDQRWVLVRTTAIDPHVATPTNLTASWVVGGNGGTRHGCYNGTHTFYPYVQAPDNWLSTGGANNYQFRWRTRYMDSDTGKWGAWSSYNSWRTYPCYIIDYFSDVKKRGKGGWAGEQAWMKDGITVNLTLQDTEDENGIVTQGNKAVEVQYGARCVGAGEKSNIVSAAAYQTVQMIYGPTMSLSQAVWTPSGYQLMFHTDYTKGQWSVYLDELKVNGKDIISKTVVFKGLSGAYGTGFLNINNTSGTIYPVGATVTAKWRCETDLATMGAKYTGSQPLQWNADHSEHAEPVVSHNYTSLIDTATVTHTAGVKVRMWARWYTTESGWRFKELPGKTNGTQTVFTYAPPLGAYQLWTTVTRNNDFWSTNQKNVYAWSGMKCHVWTSGTSLLARMVIREDEPLSLNVKLKADADVVALNKRAYETTRFGNTRSKEFSVEGTMFMHGKDSSGAPIWGQNSEHPSGIGSAELGAGYVDVKDLESLVGKHCTYRSPWGHVVDVAVTDVEYEIQRYLANATVNMIVETV